MDVALSELLSGKKAFLNERPRENIWGVERTIYIVAYPLKMSSKLSPGLKNRTTI